MTRSTKWQLMRAICSEWWCLFLLNLGCENWQSILQVCFRDWNQMDSRLANNQLPCMKMKTGKGICKPFEEAHSAVFWLAWNIWESVHAWEGYASACSAYIVPKIWGLITNIFFFSFYCLNTVCCWKSIDWRIFFAKTLEQYLKSYMGQYKSVLAFRPTGERHWWLVDPFNLPGIECRDHA